MKESLASYPVNCDGVLPKKDDTLIVQRSEASVTVFRDGRREVGCSYIETGKCTLTETLTGESLPNCAHLFPESSKPMLENHSMVGVLREMKSSVTSKEDWPYNFKKTKGMRKVEERFDDRRIDNLLKWAIQETPTLKAAATLLGTSYSNIIDWKCRFGISLPERHKAYILG